MIVLRIEDPAGWGVYRSPTHRPENLSGCTARNRPTVWSEADELRLNGALNEFTLYGQDKGFNQPRHAFEDAAALRRWFPLEEDREEIDQAGLRAVEYDVPDVDVLPLRCQVLFYTERARRVCSRRVTTMEAV